MDSRSVLIVEDEAHVRRHLAQAVEARAGLALAGAVATCAEARERIAARAPDVLLVDIGLPDGSGIELIRELRAREPEALAMVVTVFGDEKSVIEAIEAGASGYLLKGNDARDVGSAIADLIEGGSPISPAIARYLLRRLQAPLAAAAESAAGSVPELSTREKEVLRLVAKGFSYAEIADLLAISAHTVTSHVRSVYRKLEVGSRGAAVYEAVQLGLIKLSE
jgi:DNA-binding NarL/FixJ family response regulator